MDHIPATLTQQLCQIGSGSHYIRVRILRSIIRIGFAGMGMVYQDLRLIRIFRQSYIGFQKPLRLHEAAFCRGGSMHAEILLHEIVIVLKAGQGCCRKHVFGSGLHRFCSIRSGIFLFFCFLRIGKQVSVPLVRIPVCLVNRISRIFPHGFFFLKPHCRISKLQAQRQKSS